MQTVVCTKKKTKFRLEPRSPDPETPEWDWSDEEDDDGNDDKNVAKKEKSPARKCSPKVRFCNNNSFFFSKLSGF